MNYEVLILIAICTGFLLIMTKLSEIDTKLKILMSTNNIDWSLQFNEEIRHLIIKGDNAKASMALRKKTGLSLNFCLGIVQEHSGK